MKHFLCLVSLFISFLVKGQHSFSVSGTTGVFNNGDSIFISAKYPFNAFFYYQKVEDSCMITDHKFDFSLQASTPEFYIINVKTKDGKKVWKWIFLEPTDTKILINDSALKHLILTGNKSAKDYTAFADRLQEIKPPKLYFDLFRQYDSLRNKNPLHASKIKSRIDSISETVDKKKVAISLNWINEHSSSLINSYLIYYYLMPHQKDAQLKSEFYNLPPVSRKNSWGQELNYIVRNVITGCMALSFSEADTSGNEISLSDFLGKEKFILLDFWASWCGPCRQSDPALKAVYNEYKERKFTIIGISLDQSKKRWKEAIRKDKLNWPQVSDLKYWKNKTAQAYYVRSIPSNFLLDINGKIVGKNLTPEQLRRELSILYKNLNRE
ncbi:MAG: redoxin domain-containing protein [Ginsengibacter sp.]